MDTIIERPYFIGVVSRIFLVAFVTGEESGCVGLKVEIDFGTFFLKQVTPSLAINRGWMMRWLDLQALAMTRSLVWVGLTWLG